jgi:hypothetical protein
MTGKELKEFAANLPDNCLIEYKPRYDSWQLVDRKFLRAVVTPVLKINEPLETEQGAQRC